MQKSSSAIKEYLKENFPEIFLILEENPFSWFKLDRIHERISQKRQTSLKEGLEIEAHFLDIVHKAILGNSSNINLLGAFSDVFKRLSEQLNHEQRKNLRSTVYDMLASSNKNYLHFIGELMVLNQKCTLLFLRHFLLEKIRITMLT